MKAVRIISIVLAVMVTAMVSQSRADLVYDLAVDTTPGVANVYAATDGTETPLPSSDYTLTTQAVTTPDSRTPGRTGPSAGARTVRTIVLTSHTAGQVRRAIFHRGGMGSWPSRNQASSPLNCRGLDLPSTIGSISASQFLNSGEP